MLWWRACWSLVRLVGGCGGMSRRYLCVSLVGTLGCPIHSWFVMYMCFSYITPGAHTIGKSHCQNIKDRIYTNACPTRVDPFLPQRFYESLMKQCPSISSNNALDMEYVSPGKFDVAYFQTLADQRGLHTSDQDYVMNPKTWVYVYDNLKEEQFSANFAQAMVALTNVEVLTGTAGQIRKHCRFVS